jgi:poly(3-hydroxybutyrate) depolymerase
MIRVPFLLLVSSAVLAQNAKPAPSKEAELRRAIAAGWLELAAWCAEKKLATDGRRHVAEALELDPENAKAKELQAKLAGDDDVSESETKEYARKREAYGRKLSALYRELFTQKHAAGERARFDGYLVKAFELDAKGAAGLLDAEWKEAAQKKDWARAQRLLAGAERVKSDPARAKALKEAELKCAETSAVLKKASSHAIEYWLALPKGWTPSRKWPIAVGVEGAGCNFQGYMNGFLAARADRPFILLVPVTFWNTNALDPKKYPGYAPELLQEVEKTGRMKFDEEGLLAILEDVRRECSGEEKFFITGFSGGGNLTWRFVFGHPEKLAGAAPACANFYTPGPLSTAPERETLPIRAFQGDKDEYLAMLTAQWSAAKKLLDENGYGKVEYVTLPGVGHSACLKEAVDFFAGLLPAKK